MMRGFIWCRLRGCGGERALLGHHLSKLSSLNASHIPSMPGNIEPAVIPMKRRSLMAVSRSAAGMSMAVRKGLRGFSLSCFCKI